jgi:hypothetical protein
MTFCPHIWFVQLQRNPLFCELFCVSDFSCWILPPPSRHWSLLFIGYPTQRLNMKVDLQSLFGLHVTWCAQLCSLAETPQTPKSPPPPHLDWYTRALLVSKDRLFVCNPLPQPFQVLLPFVVIYINTDTKVDAPVDDSSIPGGYKEMSSFVADPLIRVQMRGERGGSAGSQPMSTAVHITWHGAQINFGDLPPYWTCVPSFPALALSHTGIIKLSLA